MLVNLRGRPNLATKPGIIILILLPESIKPLMC